MQKPQKEQSKSTQSFLKIKEVRDDLIIMKDGTLRAVIAVSSTNFDLKNEEEQNALIYSYQRFLNSLDHSVQILMQSRKMNIAQYTEKLRQIMERQTNDLLRVQTGEYIEFINRLVENANVMNKNFYVIIPFSQVSLPSAPGMFAKWFGDSKTQKAQEEVKNLDEAKHKLDQRVASVMSGLGGMSLKTIRMTTPELIELLYNSYNFESGPFLDAGKLADIKIIETES